MPRTYIQDNSFFDYTVGASTGTAYNFWSSMGAYHGFQRPNFSAGAGSGGSGDGAGAYEALGFLVLCGMGALAGYLILLGIVAGYSAGFATYAYFLSGFVETPGIAFFAAFLMFAFSQILFPALLIRKACRLRQCRSLYFCHCWMLLSALSGPVSWSSLGIGAASIAASLPPQPPNASIPITGLREGIVGGLMFFWLLLIAGIALYASLVAVWKSLVWSARMGMRGYGLAKGSHAGELVILLLCLVWLGFWEFVTPHLYYLPLGVQTFAAIELAMLVGWRRAVIATAAWLILSSFGVPLADPAMLQVRILFGPLLGFLTGLLLAVAFAGKFGFGRWVNQMFATATVSHLIFYGCGVGWLLLATGLTLSDIGDQVLLPTAVGLLASTLMTAVLLQLTVAVAKRAMEAEMKLAGGPERFAMAQ